MSRNRPIERTLSDIWGVPRAEESQICVQGNLETADHRKESCVTRVCHLHFSHLELATQKTRTDFIVAVGLAKGTRKTVRSPPISFSSSVQALNLTFSFQYQHQLKGQSDSNTIRIMLQQRIKKQHKTLAQAFVNMNEVLQAGRLEFQKDMTASFQKSDVTSTFASIFGSIATYPEDVETVEEAIEWEDYLDNPDFWSDLEGSDDELEDINSSTDNVTIIDATDSEKKTILSQQIRENQSIQSTPMKSSSKKELLQNRKGKIAKVSKLFSAVSHSRAHKPETEKDGDDSPGYDPEEVAIFQQRREYEGSSDEATEIDFGRKNRNKPEELSTSGPVADFLHQPFASNIDDEGEHQNSLFFLVTHKQKSNRFQQIVNGREQFFCNCFFTKAIGDIEEVFISILNKYESTRTEETQNLRLVIVGNDSFLNQVIRVFVDQLAKKSKAWFLDRMRFFLIPIGVNIDIARHLASVDSLYRSLFFSPEWDQFISDSKDDIPSDLQSDIFHRIERYVEEATEVHKFDIGEAFLTQASKSTQQTIKVPFLKGIRIGTVNLANQLEEKKKDLSPENAEALTSQDVDLQLDYWITKKKGETQQSVKGTFSLVGLTRLPGICNVWRIDPGNRPSATSLAMWLQFRDKKRGFVKATAAKAGMKLESHGKQQTVQAKISKITCSLAQESQEPFRVAIDGTKWKNVKFLSITPQWGTHVKFIPVARSETYT